MCPGPQPILPEPSSPPAAPGFGRARFGRGSERAGAAPAAQRGSAGARVHPGVSAHPAGSRIPGGIPEFPLIPVPPQAEGPQHVPAVAALHRPRDGDALLGGEGEAERSCLQLLLCGAALQRPAAGRPRPLVRGQPWGHAGTAMVAPGWHPGEVLGRVCPGNEGSGGPKRDRGDLFVTEVLILRVSS